MLWDRPPYSLTNGPGPEQSSEKYTAATLACSFAKLNTTGLWLGEVGDASLRSSTSENEVTGRIRLSHGARFLKWRRSHVKLNGDLGTSKHYYPIELKFCIPFFFHQMAPTKGVRRGIRKLRGKSGTVYPSTPRVEHAVSLFVCER